MNDSEGIKKHQRRAALTALLTLIVGSAVVILADVALKEAHLLHSTVAHIGTAIIVAGLVSAIFDIWYHKKIFGDPVESIRIHIQTVQEQVLELDAQVLTFGNNLGRTQEQFQQLNQTVETFAQVLKATQQNGILSILRRHSDEDRSRWRKEVQKRVSASETEILLMGRSFSDLLPTSRQDNGIRKTLVEYARTHQIVVLLPDTFSKQSQYRIELETVASGAHLTELYTRPRETLRVVLDMVKELTLSNGHSPNFAIKLATRSIPFALVMTEKVGIIEPYIPYQESGESIVFEVKAQANIYRSHRESFRQLFMSGTHVADALSDYIARKPDASIRYEQLLPIAESIRTVSDAVFGISVTQLAGARDAFQASLPN